MVKYLLKMLNLMQGLLKSRQIARAYVIYYLSYKSQPVNNLSQKNLTTFKELSDKYKTMIITQPSELALLDEHSPIISASTVSYFRRCIDQNGFVFLVYDKKTLIFRSCIQKGPYLSWIIGNAFIEIPESSHYIEFCETHPYYRGQKIFPWVLKEIKKELVNMKENALYIATDLENIASRKSIERAGFKIKEMYVLTSILLKTKKLYETIYHDEKLLVQVPWSRLLLRNGTKSFEM